MNKLEDICYRMYENSGNSTYIRAEWASKPFHPDDAVKAIQSIIEGAIPTEWKTPDRRTEPSQRQLGYNEARADFITALRERGLVHDDSK